MQPVLTEQRTPPNNSDEFIYYMTPHYTSSDHLPEHKAPATAKAYMRLRTMTYSALTLKDKYGKTLKPSKRRKIGKATIPCTQLQTDQVVIAGVQESIKNAGPAAGEGIHLGSLWYRPGQLRMRSISQRQNPMRI